VPSELNANVYPKRKGTPFSPTLQTCGSILIQGECSKGLMVHGKQNNLDVRNSPLRDDNSSKVVIIPIELKGQETSTSEVHSSNLQVQPLQLVVTT
jgi:hypothetical protein